jgi:hypothetical protein
MYDGMFWLDWMESDELNRLRMIQTLPIPTELVTLVNSYLTDLYDSVKQYGFDE